MKTNSTMSVIEDKQRFSRIISNDSGIYFDQSDDDESIQFDDEHTINHDAYLASNISDEEKKFFCANTHWTWHGEFGRLIMAPSLQYHLDYRLIISEDVDSIDVQTFNIHSSMITSDNAKAQFICHQCEHTWTSMRARCSFHTLNIDHGGIVLLKLYTQQCQSCYSKVYPRWYYDEICRVMKNFARIIFEDLFPSIHWYRTDEHSRYIRRPFQRRGSMHRPHQSLLCEACQSGYCY